MLKKDVDYTVSYANNIHPGKATLIIKGKGEYAGTKRIGFTIKRTPTVLTQSMITNKSSINAVEIQKNGAMPKPKLIENNVTLVEGKDYILSYKNNKKAGIGTIIIKGLGNYMGSLTLPFQIMAKDLTNPDITIRVPDVPYSGKANKYRSAPVLIDSDGGVLVKNRDYTIDAYTDGETLLEKKSNPKEGTIITVTLKGMGSYVGTIKATYALRGVSLTKAVIKIAPQDYTAKHITIEDTDITSATIKNGKSKKSLQLGVDYEIVAYRNNVKKGTATVTFKGIGEYSGEKTVKFKIVPTSI